MFDSIFGNEPIKAYLKRASSEERLPQTLLFSGTDGIGKSLFAKVIAKKLLGSEKSTDFHVLKPEGKSGLYAIDTLREMIGKDHAAPFEGIGKVFLLEDAHRMQPAAANALLKTLEEPSDDSTFILLTSKTQEILPTILSRCTICKFQPLKLAEIETLLHVRSLPIEFAKFAHGSIGNAIELANHPEFNEQRKILFEIMTTAPFYPELHAKLNTLQKLLEDGKDENPVRFNAQVENLFALILMWHRDQHVRASEGSAELLFFPDEPFKEPIDLKVIEEKVEKARLAFFRNMKLTHVLSEVFLTMPVSSEA